ncbi:hypothetical protein [Limnothrix redekei]|uniref:Uncharacterized protein n=1 Tax=Limnothrix redekei LRLZ20PSL1 TaxID=3112953 RepID=A0ABW7CD33_9CYAN
METLDTGLQFLYGWMPILAALAGIWIWQRYGQLGWGLFGTIALLQFVAPYIWPAVALGASNDRVNWFSIALVSFWSAGIWQQFQEQRAKKLDAESAPDRPTLDTSGGVDES